MCLVEQSRQHIEMRAIWVALHSGKREYTSLPRDVHCFVKENYALRVVGYMFALLLNNSALMNNEHCEG